MKENIVKNEKSTFFAIFNKGNSTLKIKKLNKLSKTWRKFYENFYA